MIGFGLGTRATVGVQGNTRSRPPCALLLAHAGRTARVAYRNVKVDALGARARRGNRRAGHREPGGAAMKRLFQIFKRSVADDVPSTRPFGVASQMTLQSFE